MFFKKLSKKICLIVFPIIIGVWIYNTPKIIIEGCIAFFEICLILEDLLVKTFLADSKETLESYDYIVVGAGTAGSLIAAKLSSHSNSTVLVLEAGSYPLNFHKIPVLTPLFHGTQYDWKYKTKPQLNSCGAMKNNQCKFPLGKGMGGSNLINNMIWHRGKESDFSGWFKDPAEYDYHKDIEPLFMNLEKKLQPKPLNYITKLSKILENITEINDIKFVKPLVLQKYGKRFTPFDYARNNNISHNINFVPNAAVNKINFSVDKSIKATGVTFEIHGKTYTVSSRNGVILSAGAIGTPKLLLQSGIGPCNELEKLNIKCLKNIPFVGKNLQDHVATGMSLLQFNESLNMNIINFLHPQTIYQYFNPFSSGNGPLSTVGCELLGFTNDYKIGFMFMPTDITSDNGAKLRNVLNIKNTIWENYFESLLNIQTISILPILLHPKSRGSINLKKKNNSEYYDVIIDPQYLSDKRDFNDLLNGIKLIEKLAFKLKEIFDINLKFVEKLFPGCENFTEEIDYWKCYLRNMSFGIYHPVGTCSMGPNNYTNVVDYNFKVHGVNKLYIIDASVMPNLTSSNPNAAVALLAEKFLEIYTKD